MSAPPRSPALAALLLAMGAMACGRGPEPGALAGWNVLVITVDTLRADHLGFAGYDAAETPVLDALAESGVVFEDAVSSAPLTLPSHATIFTGRFPPRHGALDNGFYSLPDDVPTLATVLREAGYATGAVVGAYVLHGQYGLDRGFDHYDDAFRQPGGDLGEHVERAGEVVTDRALAWLDARAPDRPFFLWAHFFDPHAPYDPRGSYKLRFATRPYDGEIAYTDEHIGRLLAGLAERGLRERTLVVMTADHGEAFGDGGERTHGVLLLRSTLHVPLVVNAPGRLAARRVDGVVSTADIVPTVLALVDVPPPPDIDGISLLPVIDSGESRERTAYAETRYPLDMLGWSMLAGVRTDRWSFVRGPIPELYDRSDDPEEVRNVHGEHPEEARELDARVGAVLDRTLDVAPTEMSDDDVAALRALGYVADSEVPEPSGADPKERIGIWNRINDLRAAMDAGRPQEMVDGLNEVLRDDPGNREARVMLAIGLVALGRAEDGIHQFQLLAERGWFLGRSGVLFARTLAEAGHPAEAERLVRRLEELEPKFGEHSYNLGVLLSSQGRKDEARDAFERAHRLNPEGVHVLTNLALSLSDGEDTDPAVAARALELIDRAIDYSGASDRPRLAKVELLRTLGRRDEARAVANELAAAPRYHDITPSEVADAIRSLDADTAEAR